MASQLQQDPCYLMSLPPELRLTIYNALLEDVEDTVPLAIWANADFCAYNNGSDAQFDAAALMKCCKLLHLEVHPVLHDRISVKIRIYGKPCLQTWRMNEFRRLGSIILKVPLKKLSISIKVHGGAFWEAAATNIQTLAGLLVAQENLTITGLEVRDTHTARSAIKHPVVAAATKAFKPLRLADGTGFHYSGYEPVRPKEYHGGAEF